MEEEEKEKEEGVDALFKNFKINIPGWRAPALPPLGKSTFSHTVDEFLDSIKH